MTRHVDHPSQTPGLGRLLGRHLDLRAAPGPGHGTVFRRLSALRPGLSLPVVFDPAPVRGNRPAKAARLARPAPFGT